MKLAMFYVLIFPLVDPRLRGLVGGAPVRRLVAEQRRAARPVSEILYAYTSGTGNNGSAFAGLNANTPWWNVTLGVAMLVGRFLMIIPILAIAGSMLNKKTVPPGPGTFPTNGLLFTALLVGVVVIVGALTFFPALSLGPIVEHFVAHCRDGVLMAAPKQISLFDPCDPAAGRRRQLPQARTRACWRRTRSCSSSASAAC